MIFLKPTRALLLLATLAAAAQTAAPPTAPNPKPKPRTPKSDAPALNTNLIVLDAAHGGADNGATLGGNTFEKDATVALAALLKSRLEARGFTVVLTHTAASDEVPPDARVELANRSRAVACLLLHASNGGHGVHLYTSALTPHQPSPTADDSQQIVPWDAVQASVLPQSLQLSSDLAAAVNGIRIPLVAGQASVKPIDSLSCPALALELAPLTVSDGSTPASDPAYQARVADAVAQALVFWRGHVISAEEAAAAAKAKATPGPVTAPTKPVARPKPKPVPPPVKIPDEEPLIDTPALRNPKPAPAAVPPSTRPPTARAVPVAPPTGASR